MTVVRSSHLASHVDETVTLRGWVYNKRSSGKLVFLQLRDGFGITQCVINKRDIDEAGFTTAKELSQEGSVSVTGKVSAHPKKDNVFELHVSAVNSVTAPSQAYPISPKEHGTEFLMDHRHLWMRSKRQHAILRIRHAIIKAVRDFFDEQDFTLIDAPIFTPNACEGTSTLFETEYHGQPAFLTQSGQLYMEAAAAAFGRAYCFGPTFRAEKSKTRRHLSEFWMVEPEVAFMDLDGAMDLAEDFVCFVVQAGARNAPPRTGGARRDISKLEKITKPFPRVSYSEAVDIIAEERAKQTTESEAPPLKWGSDLGAEDETLLSQRFDKPVLVHRYPAAVKAFYMKRDADDDRLALGVDMIAPEGYGEVIGGGERESELAVLEKAIADHKLPPEAFEWYLDLRRYGSVPHAGFWHGYRARRRLDLRPSPRTRDHPLPASDEPTGTVARARSLGGPLWHHLVQLLVACCF